ncbi:hypothetical protein [Pleomorphovibrio marinus]|uniref:hypothetical protein n=1 Tax=Pleomorphovibrio marinus TaxID=2164132 RepID=UPI0018E594AB|nr:hypothetical protein [Pleomorphovibrio marinus]
MNLYLFISKVFLMITLIFPGTDKEHSEKINLVLDKVDVRMDGKHWERMNLNTDNRFKIVTVIEADSEESWSVLQKMDELIEKVGLHSHYSFLVYVRGDNVDLFYSSEGDKDDSYRYPVLIDRQDVFRNANSGIIAENGYNTLLLDLDDSILKKDVEFSNHFFEKVVEHSAKQPRFIDNPPRHQIKNQ